MAGSAVAVADEGGAESSASASNAGGDTSSRTESSSTSSSGGPDTEGKAAADSDSPESIAPQRDDANSTGVVTDDESLDPELTGEVDDSDSSAELSGPNSPAPEIDHDNQEPTTPTTDDRKRRSVVDETAPQEAQTTPSTQSKSLNGAGIEDTDAVDESTAPAEAVKESYAQPVVVESSALSDGHRQQASAAPSEAEVATAALTESQAALNTLSSVLLGDPAGHVESPLVWALLAAARRHLGRTIDDTDSQELLSTNAIAAAAVNTAPTATLSRQSSPSWFSAKVTGSIKANDPDGDTLTYTGMTTTKGTVTVTTRGTFTYTPTAAARHAAAATTAEAADNT
ncbi:MAG: hypothetical protein U1C73_17205, partial [Dietzia sp.]|nr:hypothetical protein [Dietzia sp.]